MPTITKSTVAIGHKVYGFETLGDQPKRTEWKTGLVKFNVMNVDHNEISPFIKHWVGNRDREGDWLVECGSNAMKKMVDAETANWGQGQRAVNVTDKGSRGPRGVDLLIPPDKVGWPEDLIDSGVRELTQESSTSVLCFTVKTSPQICDLPITFFFCSSLAYQAMVYATTIMKDRCVKDYSLLSDKKYRMGYSAALMDTFLSTVGK